MPIAKKKNIEELEAELLELRHQLYEAKETIEAIRLGEVDALVVKGDAGNQLYALKTADQLYRIFIEKMGEGAVTLSSEGIILFCNSQFASMLKLSLTEVLGKPFRNFVPAACQAEFDVIFRGSWITDHKQELPIQSTQAIVPVQLSLSSLTLEKETVLSVIITDLTLQKMTQEQLERANRLLEESNKALELSNHDLQQFASVASHDMQEPLRKMQVLLSYVSDRETRNLSTQTAHQIDRVMQAAGRMRSLVVDVLNYSRLSSDNDPFTSVDLAGIVKEVLDDLELLIGDKKASIELGSLPVVEGSKGQLRQAIQNLIVNALKFSKPGQPPRVLIDGGYLRERSFDAALSDSGPYSLIRIKDEGIGFDEAYAGKIFSLFTRLHSKDLYEGTGIGLAIAKTVVERHGGMITARSRPDVGTEFLIVLPVRRQ
jgi:PAS domain S-box-containing protein